MEKKRFYQKPNMTAVRLAHTHQLLENSTQGGDSGGGNAREYRGDWSNEGE